MRGSVIIIIAIAFAVAGCSGAELNENQVERENIASIEEVEACLVELDACRDAGVDVMVCIDELLVCAEVGDDDLPTDPASCDAVHMICLDRGFPGALCDFIRDDCLDSEGDEWPSAEDCTVVDALCGSMGGADDECEVLSSLCDAFTDDPGDPPVSIESCEDIFNQCRDLGFDEGLCEVVRADCAASGGVGWPDAEDCPMAFELCISSGYDVDLCHSIETVCESMADDTEPEPEPSTLCEDVSRQCRDLGVDESICDMVRTDCEASGGVGWPTESDCTMAVELCVSSGYDEAICAHVEMVCLEMADDAEPAPEPEPGEGVDCDEIPALCSAVGFAEELCDLAVDRCESAPGPFPMMSDCEELAFWCAELGYDASQCDMSYSYCLSVIP